MEPEIGAVYNYLKGPMVAKNFFKKKDLWNPRLAPSTIISKGPWLRSQVLNFLSSCTVVSNALATH
jgi:hypothetical protein